MQYALVLITLAACSPVAQDVATTFPTIPDVPAGTLEVVLGGDTSALSVTVNDHVVVDRKHSRKATIAGIPAGPAHVHIAIGGSCETASVFERDLEILPGRLATIVLPGPEPSTGCAVHHGANLIYHGIIIATSTLVLLLL